MKIVIWGHKLHSHTHSYIHYAYYKAFKSLGYEVYWFDDNDDVSNFNFSNTVFFSEHQVIKKIPLKNDCKYIIHNEDENERILNAGINRQNLLNLMAYKAEEEKKQYEKLDQFSYYNRINNQIFIPWATDLLPNEIDNIQPCLHNELSDKIYYIGTFYVENGNHPVNNFSLAKKFSDEANKYNKKLINIHNISFEDNLKLTRESYLSVDFRGNCHLTNGYIPCRIMKSISYGKHIGTNSPNVARLFGEHVTYSSDTSELYYKLEKDSRELTSNKMLDNMKYIKNNHTYINRINKLMDVL